MFEVSGLRLADEMNSGNNATLCVKNFVVTDAIAATQNNRMTTE